jgi:hypothetical protein
MGNVVPSLEGIVANQFGTKAIVETNLINNDMRPH